MDVGYNLKSIKIIKTYLSQVDVEREIKIRMESSEGKLMFERKDECCLGSRSKCNFLVAVVNSRQTQPARMFREKNMLHGERERWN